MSDAPWRHLSFVAISLVGCTTLIGLPDLPEKSAGGSAGAAGSLGGSGVAGAGGSRGGNAGSSVGGSSAGGSVTKGGSSSGGDASLGGSSTGGANRGGSGVGGSEMGGSSTGGSAMDGGAGNAPDTGGTGAVGSGGTPGGSGGSGGTGGSGSACTPACDPTMECVSGDCVCPAGKTDCSGQCFDLKNDADHCGSCTHACADGCSAGRCTTRLGLLPSDVISLAVNEMHVYYTARDAGIIGRIPRDGGKAEVVADGQNHPVSIALDKSNVYWANTGDPGAVGYGSIMRRALTGGMPVEIATDEVCPMFVALDATNVYWSNYPPQPATFTKASLFGGTKTVVASTLTDSYYFSLDGGYAYWAAFGLTSVIRRVSLSEPYEIEDLTTINTYASQATVFDDDVYFVAGGPDVNPAVRKVSKLGGTDTKIIEASVGQLFVDSTGIYLGSAGLPDGTKNAIAKVSLDGSTVSVLALPPSTAYAFAVSDTEVYWVDEEYYIKKTSKTP